MFNLRQDILKKTLIGVGLVLMGLYFYSMVIFPWVTSGYDWEALQRVWHTWQALNVGMIAFGSSIIALHAAKIHADELKKRAEEQRQREFIASRAFLPGALADLCSYLKACQPVLDEVWNLVKKNGSARIEKGLIATSVPELPQGYKDVFKECIASGPPMIGNRLANILRLLQIQNSRLEGMLEASPEGVTSGVLQANVKVEFFNLAKIVALINKTYEFARGMGDFDDSPLTPKDLRTAYISLGMLFPEHYEDLLEYTERKLNKGE